MAAKSERKTMSYEWSGSVLFLSDNDKVVRKFDFAEIPEELDEQFLLLGRKTKLANFAASAKSEGRDRLEMLDEGWNLLKSGNWEFERQGGGPTVSAEVEALAEMKGTSVAAIQKALREYDAETRKGILANEKVQKIAARIRADRESGEALDLTDL
jgi:hypothetical protein